MTESIELLTQDEAAKMLRVSRKTFDTWRALEGFPIVKIGGTQRIEKAQLLNWFFEQKDKTTAGK